MDVDDYPDGEDYSMPEDTEEQRIERWKLECFIEHLGFSVPQAELLVEWKVDLHDAERLLFRNGVRTECSVELALEILSPVPV